MVCIASRSQLEFLPQTRWFPSITGKVLFSLGIIRTFLRHLAHRMFMDIASSVGITLGLIFVKPRDIQDIHAHMSVIMNEYDINLPQMPGLDFSRVEAEWTRFRGNIPELWKFNNDGREFQVGETMKARGLTAVHPVVLIPGIISTVCRDFRLCRGDSIHTCSSCRRA
jgi:hypothetical protein